MVLSSLLTVTLAAITTVALVAYGFPRSESSRGTVVHLGKSLGYDGGVFCVPYHHFCVVEPAEGQTPAAFYTFTTHPIFREQGCEVTWEPDRVFDGGLAGSTTGIFVGCGGAKFDRTGRRIFGPAPRDLDRFPVTVTPDSIIVDTRQLICGASVSGPSAPCVRAPLGD